MVGHVHITAFITSYVHRHIAQGTNLKCTQSTQSSVFNQAKIIQHNPHIVAAVWKPCTSKVKMKRKLVFKIVKVCIGSVLSGKQYFCELNPQVDIKVGDLVNLEIGGFRRTATTLTVCDMCSVRRACLCVSKEIYILYIYTQR